jgi:hypothetical protein
MPGGPRDWEQTNPSDKWMNPRDPDAPPERARPASDGQPADGPAWLDTKLGGVVATVIVIAFMAAFVAICVLVVRTVITDVRENRAQRRAEQQLQEFEEAPAPEVDLGTAPRQVAKLSLPAVPKGEFAAGGRWPRACTLLSDEEIRALVPQADRIRREGAPGRPKFTTKIYQANPFGPAVYAGNESQTVAVPEQTCTITFRLPHKHRTAPLDEVGTLVVAVDIVARPKTVYLFGPGHDEDLQEFIDANNARRCSEDSEHEISTVDWYALQCAKGRLAVSVNAWVTARDPDYHHIETLHIAGRPEGESPEERFYEAVRSEAMVLLLRKVP